MGAKNKLKISLKKLKSLERPITSTKKCLIEVKATVLWEIVFFISKISKKRLLIRMIEVEAQRPLIEILKVFKMEKKM